MSTLNAFLADNPHLVTFAVLLMGSLVCLVGILLLCKEVADVYWKRRYEDLKRVERSRQLKLSQLGDALNDKPPVR